MIQVLISNRDATRIQTTGGSTAFKYFLTIVAPSVNGQRYFSSLWCKNNGAKPVTVINNLVGGTVTIQPGASAFVRMSGKGDGTLFLNMMFMVPTAADNLDVTVWNPVAWRSQATSSTENLISAGDRTFAGAWGGFSGAVATITQNQTRTIDYTQYVSSGSLVIDDKLNQTSQCQFTLTNNDDTFVIPSREAYVQIFSVQYNKYIFTGFISNDIPKDFVGLNSSTPSMDFQTYRFSIQVAGDEYLLGQKAVPLLPPFVNMGAGQILATLANTLTPGFFDVTSQCASGDLVPYMEYDPNKNWTVIAKELADQFRYRVRILNKVLYYKPWGDQTFPVSYDETKSQRTFDPFGLKTTIFDSTLVNDAIVIGDAEAADNHEDYFVGDGFTSNFPLRYTAFEADTALLLKQDWTSGGINSSQWFTQDPVNTFATVGALNVNGGTNHFGETFVYLRTGLDLGRKLILEHGEVFFVGNCSGAIIGGVYDNASTFAEVNGSGQCECGFDIRPASGFSVAISVSGVSGLQIQPRRLGQLVGTPIITQQNHYYILRTIINGKSHNRYTSTFKSFTGAIIRGGTNAATADITWVIQDINLNNTNPNQPGFVNIQPPITETRFTLNSQPVPAFAIYCLLNISNANFTLTWTNLFDPPQGSLSVAALTGASGAQLPILPSNIGSQLDYELGFGLGRQVATVGNSNSGEALTSDGTGSMLQFYSDSIPGVGSRIRFQAWESQTAIARVQDSSSITKEAGVVGDDGKRTTILTDFKPLPRSSEECELAGKAILLDRLNSLYQGSYSVSQFFFDFVNNDFPRTGRFFVINSPKRNINNLSVVVSSVRLSYKELFSEQVDVTVNFGPTKFLENLLATFITKPNDVLMPKDTAQQPTPIQLANIGLSFAGDIDSVRLTGGVSAPFMGFDSTNAYFDVGAVPVTAIEVRRANVGWGVNNNDRLGIFTTRTFSLPRTQFDQTWYARQINGSFISRRSKVLRIAAPIIPAAPAILSADSKAIQLNFNGDIRNLYGVELRANDNSTVIDQSAVASIQDLYFDLQSIPTIRKLYGVTNYALWTDEFDNAVWQKSNSTTVTPDNVNSPQGFPTADTITKGANGSPSNLNWIQQAISNDASQQWTFSVWLKVASGSLIGCNINIGDGTFTSFVGPQFTVTTTWQRFSFTVNAGWMRNTGSIFFGFNFPSSSASGTTMQAWGAQMELGVLGPYFANDNTIGPPRNRVIASEEFDNSLWTKTTGVTVTANSIADPFGNLTADKIVYDGSGTSGSFRIFQIHTPGLSTLNTPYVSSVWLKADALVTVRISVIGTGGVGFTTCNLTTVWQRFSVVTLGDNTNAAILGIWSPAATNTAFTIYAFGGQGEKGESATTYIGVAGSLTVSVPFYAYFFNTMWEYSQALVINIPGPSSPVLTLGNKFGNLVETRLDQLTRSDIRKTTYQISTDSTFATGVIQTVGNGQPATMAVTVPNSAGSAFSARSRRTDFFGDGPWSATLNIPYGNLISSNWSVGQGSIPPTLDNQTAALFTYTSSANSGGGANSASISWSWPSFTIIYADNTQQSVASGTAATGTTLTSSTIVTTPYWFYSRVQANIVGATVEFVGSPIAHTAKNNTDAAACVADGYVALGGSALSMLANVPIAPTGGGSSSGGGGDGGSDCIAEEEVLETPTGNLIAMDSHLNQLLKGYDIENKKETWNAIYRLLRTESHCIKIILEDGSTSKGVSTSTSLPIWKEIDGELVLGAAYAKDLNCQMYLMNKKLERHRIKEIIDLGYIKVISIELRPNPLYFAGDLLISNGIVLPK